MENDKNISEQLFEQFCQNNNIPFKRICTTSEKTPDYEILINDIKIISEIKEIDDDECNKAGVLEVYHIKTGEKLRQKIMKSRKQLQEYSKKGNKTLLVIYNNIDKSHLRHTEATDFSSAMYGEHTILLKRKGNETRYVKSFFGKKKKFTEKDNTSFSGIAHLKPVDNKLQMDIYLNSFAKNKIDINIFNKFDSIDLFEIKDPTDYHDWEKI